MLLIAYVERPALTTVVSTAAAGGTLSAAAATPPVCVPAGTAGALAALAALAALPVTAGAPAPVAPVALSAPAPPAAATLSAPAPPGARCVGKSTGVSATTSAVRMRARKRRLSIKVRGTRDEGRGTRCRRRRGDQLVPLTSSLVPRFMVPGHTRPAGRDGSARC